MQISGIDPVGLVRPVGDWYQWMVCTCAIMATGIIRSTARDADTDRLAAIADQLEKIISAERPEAAIIEEIFVVNNPRSALRLGMARGEWRSWSAGAQNCRFMKFLHGVKQAVTGTGKADKKQVCQMVAKLPNIKAPPSDAGDALATAIAGLQGDRSKLASADHIPSPSTGLEQAMRLHWSDKTGLARLVKKLRRIQK